MLRYCFFWTWCLWDGNVSETIQYEAPEAWLKSRSTLLVLAGCDVCIGSLECYLYTKHQQGQREPYPNSIGIGILAVLLDRLDGWINWGSPFCSFNSIRIWETWNWQYGFQFKKLVSWLELNNGLVWILFPLWKKNSNGGRSSFACVAEPCIFQYSYLVDPASSHMLVSKIKPCMSKYKQLYSETANGSLNQLSFIW